MKQIWKFTLAPDGMTILMPRGAKVLHVDNQAENLCLWALVDPSEQYTPRTFLAVRTGEQIANINCAHYYGSALFRAGRVVLHVFEIDRP